MAKGIGGHQSAIMKSDEWLTPPEILRPLGEFDLDPCSPVFRPWSTAKNHYTIEDNGLIKEWWGRVWMNPPYGSALINWLSKMAGHGMGIALTFARTDTEAFHRYVFGKADSLLFLEGRLNFHTVAGTRARFNAGAPSVLIAYGEENVEALDNCQFKGKHVHLTSSQLVIVGVSPQWKCVVSIALTRIGTEAALAKIYEVVETIAPDKIHKNKHYKEKVRQILQQHFSRVGKGRYASEASNSSNSKQYD